VAELQGVAAARAALPTDRQLAERLGCSCATVKAYWRGYRPNRHAATRDGD
jgi:hypothetical protein